MKFTDLYTKQLQIISNGTQILRFASLGTSWDRLFNLSYASKTGFQIDGSSKLSHRLTCLESGVNGLKAPSS